MIEIFLAKDPPDSNDMQCIMKVFYCQYAVPSAAYCIACRAGDQWIQGRISQDALLCILNSLHGATLRLVYRSGAQTLEITRDRTNMIGHIYPEGPQVSAELHNRQNDNMDCGQEYSDEDNNHIVNAHNLLLTAIESSHLFALHLLLVDVSGTTCRRPKQQMTVH